MAFSINLSDKIEHFQKRSMQIIYPELSYDAGLDETKCSTLRARRDLMCTRIFEKIRQPFSRLNHLTNGSRCLCNFEGAS